MRVLFALSVLSVIVPAPARAQSYDFNAQRSDIQQMEEELARQQRQLDFTSSHEQRQRLQDQQFRLQEMDRRNREAETDWILNGDRQR